MKWINQDFSASLGSDLAFIVGEAGRISELGDGDKLNDAEQRVVLASAIGLGQLSWSLGFERCFV